MDDDGRELGAFLRSRRARVAPDSVGIAAGTRRRVPGLRREELAQLAGISVDYYVRLEQGRATQPSPEILDALADVLGLGRTEREHLRALTAAPRKVRRSSRRHPERVRPELQRLLDAMYGLPALITGHRQDVLAWNRLGSELFGGLGEGRRDHNNARYLFLDPVSRETFPDWEQRARETVAVLRLAAGRHADDERLRELVGELSVRSEDFGALWASADVMVCGSGTKRFRHPAVGELTLRYETLQLPVSAGQAGQELHVYNAGEDGGAEEALRLLGTWTASPR
ncbi:helix-turn-helix transcriptional regulator [Actinoallomurus sp. NBC_01490]|uniref:helix-turn-helix transcriptional regulator n=1 Tax=Actinoallomurus sp. NBC_01490 TaxID=2903557 RepID=UPI002E3476E4|nr:helix-turn-helix transcriptional regulator [Actinoallomurus sp. NBC_01490]